MATALVLARPGAMTSSSPAHDRPWSSHPLRLNLAQGLIEIHTTYSHITHSHYIGCEAITGHEDMAQHRRQRSDEEVLIPKPVPSLQVPQKHRRSETVASPSSDRTIRPKKSSESASSDRTITPLISNNSTAKSQAPTSSRRSSSTPTTATTKTSSKRSHSFLMSRSQKPSFNAAKYLKSRKRTSKSGFELLDKTEAASDPGMEIYEFPQVAESPNPTPPRAPSPVLLTPMDWSEPSTRKEQYEKIDKENRGARGVWNKVWTKFGFKKAEPGFYEEGKDDDDSVRRYRLDLDNDGNVKEKSS